MCFSRKSFDLLFEEGKSLQKIDAFPTPREGGLLGRTGIHSGSKEGTLQEG